MTKTIAVSLALATIACQLVSAAPAKAGDGVGVGLAAGLIGGAIVGGAIASSRPAYPAPVYVEPAPPPVPPGCYWQRQRYWDGYGWTYQPVRVCY
jgi:hypothetical protein